MQKTQCFNKKDLILKINNTNYSANIYSYRDFMAFTRRQEIFLKKSIYDVFVPNAMIAFADDIKQNICLNIFKEKFKLDSSHALYIPPYCPIRWDLEPQVIIWKAIFFSPLDNHPKEPFIFDRDDLNKFLSGKNVKGTFFEYIKKVQYVPLKTKEYIDLNFKNECNIEKMSKELKISKFTISHYFKDVFGLSPVSYRNLLRSSYSHYLLLEKNYLPKEASKTSGFLDYSRFFINFKRNFKSSPNEFKLRKNFIRK